MLTLNGWGKWVIPLLIVVVLFCGSCSFVAPQPVASTPPDVTTPEPPPENQRPVIGNITAQQQVSPSSNSRITCVATDADEDTLTYTWSSSRGTIIGSGDTVTWTAPAAAGSYVITAIVTDGKGGEARESVNIAVTVKPNRAPSITLVTRAEKNTAPVTVDPKTGTIKVKKFSSTEIECIAEDPDGDALTFKWSATGGKIEG